mgnify:CR=1 FL=1
MTVEGEIPDEPGDQLDLALANVLRNLEAAGMHTADLVKLTFYFAEAVDAVSRPDTPADAVEVRHWGGAMARPDGDAGPVGHRDVPFSITVDGPAEAVAPLTPLIDAKKLRLTLAAPPEVVTADRMRIAQPALLVLGTRSEPVLWRFIRKSIC